MRVNEKVIDKRLREAAFLLTEGPLIKLLFLVSETKEGVSSYWWKDPEANYALSSTELLLHNAFQKRGFSPINRTLNMPETEFSEDLRVVDLQDSDVLKWGRLFSARVVIYGQTEIGEEKELFLTLRAFDVNQDVQIFQDMQVETIEGGLEGQEAMIKALESMVNQLAERFAPPIIRKITSGYDQIQQLEIMLR